MKSKLHSSLIILFLQILYFPVMTAQPSIDIFPEGVVFPKMTTVDRDALTPMMGQFIYNTDSHQLNYYDGSQWIGISYSQLQDEDGDTRVEVESTPDSDTIKLVSGGREILRVLGSASGRERVEILNAGGNTFLGHKSGEDNIYIPFVGSTGGRYNSFLGTESGASNSTGSSNSFFGFQSGHQNIEGSGNSFFGADTGASNTDGAGNTFIGNQSGASNEIGSFNTYLGQFSGGSNRTGSYNVVIGDSANVLYDSLNNATAIGAGAEVGCNNCAVIGGHEDINFGLGTEFPESTLHVEGDSKFIGKMDLSFSQNDRSSVFIGRGAGENFRSAGFPAKNTFIGYFAGNSNLGTAHNTHIGAYSGQHTFGPHNAFLGNQSGRNNTSGSRNSFFGSEAGISNTSGQYNSFFGFRAGGNNVKGHWNSIFGYRSDVAGISPDSNMTRTTLIGAEAKINPLMDSLDRAIALGFNSVVSCHNCAVVGGSGSDAVKVGIGLSSPRWRMTVKDTQNAIAGTKVDISNLALVLVKESDNNDEAVGLGFQSSSNTGSVGAAIIHERTGSTSRGSLHFATKEVSGQGVDIPIRMTLDRFGKLGIGDITPDFTLDVEGDINYTGTLTNISDLRLKENVRPISNAVQKVTRLNGIQYNLIDHPDKRSGVIAQEVLTALPEAVRTNGDGYLAVDYSQLIPLLVEAIKEQQIQIERLEKEMEATQNTTASKSR